MNRPDFGWQETYHAGIKLTCRYVAPNLTMSDLTKIFEEARSQATESDHLSADPSKWPDVCGINAVTEAILNAIYEKDKE